MRSTVPLKLAVLLKLGRNFVDSRLPQKRSNPLPLQLRGACPPRSMKPPESGTKLQKSYQLNCSNSDCFIDFLVFLWANLATDCSTFAFLKVTLRPGFKPKKVHRHSYKSYGFWISFSDSRLVGLLRLASVGFASIRSAAQQLRPVASSLSSLLELALLTGQAQAPQT